MIDIDQIIRKNIASLQPYSSARDEYSGDAMVFLDANENPFNTPYNRYPDPLQTELKKKISRLKNAGEKNIFLGNGSDEAIDLLIRILCIPGKDNIVGIDPSYGMYRVCAAINNIEYRKTSLAMDFGLDTEATKKLFDNNTKIIFLCSPNNPTGNSLDRDAMLDLVSNFKGIVVIDEAYIDFAGQDSLLPSISQYNNLVILQTFSKAWGLAGIRLGMAFGDEKIIAYMNKVKYPYNVNILTQNLALQTLEEDYKTAEWIKTILNQRSYLEDVLNKYSFVQKIYPSDANFILVKMDGARKIYEFLIEKKIILRDRSNVHLCDNALRITVGTPDENGALTSALTEYAAGI
jgi:histidinol-phosphate aminotransferase